MKIKKSSDGGRHMVIKKDDCQDEIEVDMYTAGDTIYLEQIGNASGNTVIAMTTWQAKRLRKALKVCLLSDGDDE